jgi:hypothetical protein
MDAVQVTLHHRADLVRAELDAQFDAAHGEIVFLYAKHSSVGDGLEESVAVQHIITLMKGEYQDVIKKLVVTMVNANLTPISTLFQGPGESGVGALAALLGSIDYLSFRGVVTPNQLAHLSTFLADDQTLSLLELNGLSSHETSDWGLTSLITALKSNSTLHTLKLSFGAGYIPRCILGCINTHMQGLRFLELHAFVDPHPINVLLHLLEAIWHNTNLRKLHVDLPMKFLLNHKVVFQITEAISNRFCRQVLDLGPQITKALQIRPQILKALGLPTVSFFWKVFYFNPPEYNLSCRRCDVAGCMLFVRRP